MHWINDNKADSKRMAIETAPSILPQCCEQWNLSLIDTLQIALIPHVLCVVHLSCFPMFLRQNLRNQVWLQKSSLERF